MSDNGEQPIYMGYKGYKGMYDGESLEQIKKDYLLFPNNLIYRDCKTKDNYDIFCSDYLEIAKAYHRYKRGTKFHLTDSLQKRLEKAEITDDPHLNENYIHACMHLRKIAQLINKQSRFLFGKEPDVNLNLAMDLGDDTETMKQSLDILREMLGNVIETTEFMSKLFTASKDCAIGKRVACVVNFNQESGVTIDFIPAFNFVYEYDETEQSKLKYFAFFKEMPVSAGINCSKWYIKKSYEMVEVVADDGETKKVCKIQEFVYDEKCVDVTDEYLAGGGQNFDNVTELEFIPAEVIINTGLLNDTLGVSDVEELKDYEAWYNAINCLDIDSLRKSMHPTKYTIDMDANTTQRMFNAPGAYIDLTSDRNEVGNNHPQIGILEPSLNFAQPLKDLLSSIDKEMHDFVDVPDIDLETMSGVITSGKALKALYWGLIQRCDEKMKVWAPAIARIMTIVIEGCFVYPDIADKYLGGKALPTHLNYEFEIVRNNPLPEEEDEEKTLDMQAVDRKLMSRQAYIMKWNGWTESKANKEIIQIAVESGLLENLAIPDGDLSDNSLWKELQRMNGEIDEETDDEII